MLFTTRASTADGTIFNLNGTQTKVDLCNVHSGTDYIRAVSYNKL